MDCTKHDKPVPMLPVKAELNTQVGYYCALCHDFKPDGDEAQLDLLKYMVKNLIKP